MRVTGSVRERLTAKRETAPVSGSRVATASATATSPKRAVSYVGALIPTWRTSPTACCEAWAKGWKVVWRQLRPPGSVMIGAMTLTSCASDAACTRSVLRRSEMSRFPTTTASATLYRSSRSTGATGQSSPVGGLDSARFWYQTFHSSKEMLMRFVCLPAART